MVRRAVLAAGLAAICQLATGCVVVTRSSRDGSGASFFLLVLPFALVVLMVRLSRGRRRRSLGSRQARSMSDEKRTVNEELLRAELSVLADDVIRLEPQVAVKEEARDDFDAATHRYRVAQAAMDYAKEPVDLVRVQRVVDEATWSMARARAVLDGRPLPAPPATLRRPGRHGEPAIGLEDGHRPVYMDSPAPFRSGWFAAGGGLFGGLLMGSMLGGFGGVWIVDEEAGEFEEDPNERGDVDW